MARTSTPITILIAEDDQDDCLLMKEALSESHFSNTINFVHDGEELMDYLLHRGRYAHNPKESAPKPGLILLDLNMPKKDGREALSEIKAHKDLHSIPVIVLTTSRAEEDIFRSYNLGVNSFISKPVTFESLVQVVRDLGRYWLEIVELPIERRARD